MSLIFSIIEESRGPIVGNEALSWSQAGPEDFILLHKYMLQGLSCSSYVIKLHSGMHSSMNPRNDVLKHGYKIWSVAILRSDFILLDRERKWKIQHCEDPLELTQDKTLRVLLFSVVVLRCLVQGQSVRRGIQRTNSAPKVSVPFVVAGGRRLVRELHINYNMREVLSVLAGDLNYHPDDVSGNTDTASPLTDLVPPGRYSTVYSP